MDLNDYRVSNREMHKENTVYGAANAVAAEKLSGAPVSTAAPLHLSRSNPFLSPRPIACLNSNASYPVPSKSCSSNPPYDCFSLDGEAVSSDRRLQNSSSILQYQQLYNRYTLCLSQLHDSVEEVDALRCENESLRLSNADLTNRVAFLFSRDQMFSNFNCLSIMPNVDAPPASHHVAELNRIDRAGNERVSLPKSIAVRSSGYLKMNRPGQETSRQKSVSQSITEPQRVYVPGSEKEDESLEFEVYNQGMFKTELCNKWQETGTCPYGENCQFAHGIKELRPVIRHPRYKTEVCRMVLTGDICPYGHRCHFRHSLTEEERLMVQHYPVD